MSARQLFSPDGSNTSKWWAFSIALAAAVVGSVVLTGQPLQAQPVAADQSRHQKALKLADQIRNRKQNAWLRGRERGWLLRGDMQGRATELMAIHDGGPEYYMTCNLNAAISTAADRVRLPEPYDLSGTGLTVGVWDGGAVRSTHRELAGRVTIVDGGSLHAHSTHVGGTIASAGFMADAMGMAPQVQLDSYDWTDDVAEMIDTAASGPQQAGKIYLSNHSYGITAGWIWGSFSGSSGHHWFGMWGYRESDYFGRYSSKASTWDDICFDAPYFLPFKVAGNDRDDNHPSGGTTFYYYDYGEWQQKNYDPETDPYSDGWDSGGYDSIPYDSTSKNMITVGAVNDAVSGGERSLAAASMSNFSCWGPTDDGRVKPDVVADGVNLYSTTNSHDAAYSYMSGTSMAAPNACGSATLLVEYFNRLNPGSAMRSSSLKGLIIHTADDLGRPGPDYQYGWGLVNTQAAADLIDYQNVNPEKPVMVESSLDSRGDHDQYSIYSDGQSTVKVTLCWTDPAHSALSGLDNPVLTLVNDLDLEVLGPGGSDSWLPFVLDPGQPEADAGTGTNIRDNVEQVIISPPVAPGTYVIDVRIDERPTTTQYYSLIISQTIQAPGNPTAVADGPGQVTLQWQDRSVSETGFIIQRRPYQGVNAWHELAVVGPDTTQYVDTDSIGGMVEYVYRIGVSRE